MATKTKFGNNHFATGHFKLVIDGKPVTAHIHGVEGGLISAAAVEEAVGQYNLRGRHLGTREVEALSLEFGMSGSKWVLDTIDKFIANRQTKRFSGEVIHGDTNMTAQYFYTFSDALVTEVTFPKLDANSRETAMLKVKLQPQDVTFQLGDGRKLDQDPVGRQKTWQCANFRINFDNGCDATYVSTIEAMTIKAGVKPMQLGDMFRPDNVPTRVEMPKLSISLPLVRAGSFIKWYKESVANQQSGGTADADGLGTAKSSGGYETSCSIEFLDPKLKTILYEIELFGVGMEKFSIPKSEVNAVAVKMAKFDFYVTSVKVKSNGAGFQ